MINLAKIVTDELLSSDMLFKKLMEYGEILFDNISLGYPEGYYMSLYGDKPELNWFPEIRFNDLRIVIPKEKMENVAGEIQKWFLFPSNFIHEQDCEQQKRDEIEEMFVDLFVKVLQEQVNTFLNFPTSRNKLKEALLNLRETKK